MLDWASHNSPRHTGVQLFENVTTPQSDTKRNNITCQPATNEVVNSEGLYTLYQAAGFPFCRNTAHINNQHQVSNTPQSTSDTSTSHTTPKLLNILTVEPSRQSTLAERFSSIMLPFKQPPKRPTPPPPEPQPPPPPPLPRPRKLATSLHAIEHTRDERSGPGHPEPIAPRPSTPPITPAPAN